MAVDTLPALLREEAAELLALFPAARRAAAGGPAGGEAALDGMARAAYRVLRLAENAGALAALEKARPVPLCLSRQCAAYVRAAADVCRFAHFVPVWPRGAVWTPGHPQFFAAALGSLLAEALAGGGERPVVSVRLAAAKGTARLIVTRRAAPDSAGVLPAPAGADALGLALVRRYAAWCGGRFLRGTAGAGGVFASLSLPVCPPGPPAPPPGYAADRFSALYVQLSGVCDLPL